MRFAFIAVEKARYPVTVLCRVLAVSRSGFYAWSRRGESTRQRANRLLRPIIRAEHLASRGTYGSPRLQVALRARGHRVGRNRLARLMREDGLQARRRRRFRVTTNSNHHRPVAPNRLDRRFYADAPNQAWVSDLTYLWTAAGWLYLCVVLDLYSRRVVGWAMSASLGRELVLQALRMAFSMRAHPQGVLCHSDRGSQYASADVRNLLAQHGATASMSGRGNCFDNAVAESFFATLKIELVRDQRFTNREQAWREVFDYIEIFYNQQRLHSYLGYQSPAAFEAQRKEGSLT
jgi:putative transposase